MVVSVSTSCIFPLCQAWMGHPYVDVIDNTDCDRFEDKMLKLIQVVCDRAGVEYHDRLAKNSRKRKWLVSAFEATRFGAYEEFEVFHDYLKMSDPSFQVRPLVCSHPASRCVSANAVKTAIGLTRSRLDNHCSKASSRSRRACRSRNANMNDIGKCGIHNASPCANGDGVSISARRYCALP
jgi:hypothetical protein